MASRLIYYKMHIVEGLLSYLVFCMYKKHEKAIFKNKMLPLIYPIKKKNICARHIYQKC